MLVSNCARCRRNSRHRKAEESVDKTRRSSNGLAACNKGRVSYFNPTDCDGRINSTPRAGRASIKAQSKSTLKGELESNGSFSHQPTLNLNRKWFATNFLLDHTWKEFASLLSVRVHIAHSYSLRSSTIWSCLYLAIDSRRCSPTPMRRRAKQRVRPKVERSVRGLSFCQPHKSSLAF